MKFYKCKNCNNILKTEQAQVIQCCQSEMEELMPGSIEASLEKHIPKVEIEDTEIVVTVGAIEHPMTKEHYIEWILVELENGYMVTYLKPEEKPIARFNTNQKLKAVYTYCNIHGLWKLEI